MRSGNRETVSEPSRLGWRAREWSAVVGVSTRTARHWITENQVATVRVGGNRIIVESPADFLKRMSLTK